MALPNIFTQEVSDKIISRINNLSATSPALWGKMNVAQMLAHCSVTYEMIYEHHHPAPKGIMKLMLKLLIKGKVVSETPYKQNNPTAPAFVVKEAKDFEKEKYRLINFIRKTQELGEAEFHNKPSLSFGPLTKTEWNNMLYKHLNHHLTQFGV